MFGADDFVSVLAAAHAHATVDHDVYALNALARSANRRAASKRVLVGQQREGGEVRRWNLAKPTKPPEVERTAERADELEATIQCR